MKQILLSKSGFTLIELMVVIAVIGILAAIAYPQYSLVQIKARDAERKSNLADYHLALQRHFGETGNYPAGGDGLSPYQDASADTATGIFDDPNPLTAKEFMPGPLLDPVNSVASQYYYRYLTDRFGNKYVLYAKLEAGDTTWWTQPSTGVAEGTNDEPVNP